MNLSRDKDSGLPRGFAFLAYSDQRSTVLAVDNLNGITLADRTIRVDHVLNYRSPEALEEERERRKRERTKYADMVTEELFKSAAGDLLMPADFSGENGFSRREGEGESEGKVEVEEREKKRSQVLGIDPKKQSKEERREERRRRRERREKRREKREERRKRKEEKRERRGDKGKKKVNKKKTKSKEENNTQPELQSGTL